MARKKEEDSMALICVSGAKECYGCDDCLEKSGGSVEFCSLCRMPIRSGGVYEDFLYDALCLSCLRSLHAKDTNDISCLCERR